MISGQRTEMENKELIRSELEQLSTLVASIPSYNVFSVPDRYFTDFPAECMNWISVSPYFGTQVPPQQVPQGYFDHLASDVLQRVKTESEPVLIYNSKNNPYSVPTGYFDQLPGEILQKVDSPARIISISKRFFRYAAAAVITGILGLSLFNRINDRSVVFSEKVGIAQLNIDRQLENINDKEIVDYLKNNGQDVDAALVASITDDNNLPSNVDYLINENTLSDLLSEKNIRQSNN